MDIVIAGWSCSPLFPYGGLDTFILNLSEALIKKGHSVTVVGCHPDPSLRGRSFKIREGLRAYVPCTVTDLQEDNITQIWIDLAGMRISSDLIIINDFHIAPPLVWRSKVENVKAIYYMHIFSGLPWDFASLADQHVIASTNSKLMRNMIKPLLDIYLKSIGQREKEIHVIYPGIPKIPEPKESKVAEIRRRLLKGSKYLVHVHGRAGQPNKNIEMITDIIRELRRIGVDARGFVTGRGWEPKEDKYVTWIGEIPQEDLGSYYSAGDVFVLPSTMEPYGLVALEALESGTVPVLSERSGVYEVLSEIGVPSADPGSPRDFALKIKDLLEDEDLRETILSSFADRLRPRLTWDSVADSLLGLKELDNF